MELGMYSVELKRPDAESLFAAVREYGFTAMQFNYSSVYGEEMPLHIESEMTARIRSAAEKNGVKIVAVNGTFNMIHPDKEVRKEGLRRFEDLASHMHELNCNFVTLCTGSRSLEGMWRMHPDTQSEAAWNDLLETMQEVLKIAEKYDLLLGLETEPTNVINTPERCRKLMDTFGTHRLRVIMDIANQFNPGMAHKENVSFVMDHAFGLLGDAVQLAHGKDILEGDTIRYTYAGNGIVDFSFFRQKLEDIGYSGCMLLHGIKDEARFPDAIHHIRRIFG